MFRFILKGENKDFRLATELRSCWAWLQAEVVASVSKIKSFVIVSMKKNKIFCDRSLIVNRRLKIRLEMEIAWFKSFHRLNIGLRIFRGVQKYSSSSEWVRKGMNWDDLIESSSSKWTESSQSNGIIGIFPLRLEDALGRKSLILAKAHTRWYKLKPQFLGHQRDYKSYKLDV